MNTQDNISTPASRPLGFWLQTVDRLIEREFETAFADEGITRRDWRLLRVLGGDVDAPELIERLQRRGKRLRGLVERGWVTETEGSWTLTDEGRAATERLGIVVSGIRSKIAGSVSEAEFATTLRSLEAIARELGWEEGTPTPGAWRGGRGRRGFGRGFQPGFRRGFGPGAGRGFGPGFHPGFDDGHGCDAHHGRGRGHGLGHGHGHGFGHGRARHGFGPGGQGFGAAAHIGERAYERGFEAGFARGSEARSA